jgi:hypothetical protein
MLTINYDMTDNILYYSICIIHISMKVTNTIMLTKTNIDLNDGLSKLNLNACRIGTEDHFIITFDAY